MKINIIATVCAISLIGVVKVATASELPSDLAGLQSYTSDGILEELRGTDVTIEKLRRGLYWAVHCSRQSGGNGYVTVEVVKNKSLQESTANYYIQEAINNTSYNVVKALAGSNKPSAAKLRNVLDWAIRQKNNRMAIDIAEVVVANSKLGTIDTTFFGPAAENNDNAILDILARSTKANSNFLKATFEWAAVNNSPGIGGAALSNANFPASSADNLFEDAVRRRRTDFIELLVSSDKVSTDKLLYALDGLINHPSCDDDEVADTIAKKLRSRQECFNAQLDAAIAEGKTKIAEALRLNGAVVETASETPISTISTSEVQTIAEQGNIAKE